MGSKITCMFIVVLYITGDPSFLLVYFQGYKKCAKDEFFLKMVFR